MSTQAKAAAVAKAYLEARHQVDVLGVCLRADEPARWVFAVMYKAEIKPAPYIIVEIGKSTFEAIELAEADAEQYFIQNYR